MIGTPAPAPAFAGYQGLIRCKMTDVEKAAAIAEAAGQTGISSAWDLASSGNLVSKLADDVEAKCVRDRRRRIFGAVGLFLLAVVAGLSMRKGGLRLNSSRKKKKSGLGDFLERNWWRAVGVGVGVPLILIPEPATTATGLALVSGSILVPGKK